MENSNSKNVTYRIKRELLERKTVVVGTMFRVVKELDEISKSQRCHPLELARGAGFSIVVIDCEHEAFDQERLAEYALIAHKIGISLWMRPTQREEEAISKYADIGFNGFMIPNAVELPRIRNIISQAYYDPIANPSAYIRRGYSGNEVLIDGQDYDSIREEMDYINNNMVVAIQTEHPDGIKNLVNLLSVSDQGIIGTIIGPNDLAINLSISTNNRRLLDLKKNEIHKDTVIKRAFKEIGRIARSCNKVAGIHFTEPEQKDMIRELIADDYCSYRLILYGTEKNIRQDEFSDTQRFVESIIQ